MSQGHSESKMELMTLPIELVEMAVIEAIGIVGLLKAMKLRVVNSESMSLSLWYILILSRGVRSSY